VLTPQRKPDAMPANQTYIARFDLDNPFFSVDYGSERDMEEEMMLQMDRDDPDAYTVSVVMAG
jgi:hypothetical protein